MFPLFPQDNFQAINNLPTNQPKTMYFFPMPPENEPTPDLLELTMKLVQQSADHSAMLITHGGWIAEHEIKLRQLAGGTDEPPSYTTYRRGRGRAQAENSSMPPPVSLITEELAFAILSLPVNDDSRDWLESQVQLFVSDDARLYPELAIENLLNPKHTPE